MKMIPVIKMVREAKMIGSFALKAKEKPAMRAGMAWERANIDCWMPKISPWEDGSTEFEVNVERFGGVKPKVSAFNGMMR
ncbi:MAG: hypothetical protein A2912_03705 [Candidatus Buchananbacteria bacterium RIFCSPLOWO2_01_FULL_40_23b]|uniref:Uncharacterized protein n=1 Tax=Candidatus Buchananbacteria bacterium RIFCSPLOWO2_01_FULL_40_23b TaxID=1797544 RepID=A0A1G1YPI7_9BACT|nr:MAG: hypothetical protein A2912_03705 [Candidatus Buchananbacteria bacterium RIFCSPLOWO2_01_FULL_40_23b]